jgi:hypothetical protein
VKNMSYDTMFFIVTGTISAIWFILFYLYYRYK